MTTELRDYRIEPGRLDDFLTGWRNGVVPLRRRFGFAIDGAWVVEDESRFIWLLSLDDAEDWDARDEAYYASSERKALEPDPARLIQHGVTAFIRPVPLGPEAD